MDYNRILYGEINFVPGERITTGQQQPPTGQSHAAHTLQQQQQQQNQSQQQQQQLQHNHHQQKQHQIQNQQQQHAQPQQLFQAPKQQLCDPKIINLSWLQSERIGGGLINVGNTCFLNSVLQCLTYCPPLHNYLIKHNGGHSQTCKINGFCMLCELEKHIKRTRFSAGNAIKPMSIVQRLKYINKSFQHGRQEDAHELLRYIIDHMWKACLSNLDINSNSNKIDNKIKETTAINYIFGGYQRSQVLCLICGTRSDTYDYFMDLMLDIKGSKSLEEALRKYTKAETLDSDNAYRCGRCKRQVTARKRLSVFKAPNVATFQFKRFDADRIFGGKITKYISYPEELDLKPYMSDSSQSTLKYHLNAVLVHIGHSSSSGHYFCFVKNSNNCWYRMDDSEVSVVNKNLVLQQQAYILFYTRKASDIKQTPPTNGIKEQKSNSSQVTTTTSAAATAVETTTTTTTIPATIATTNKMSNSTTSNILNLSNTAKSKTTQQLPPTTNGHAPVINNNTNNNTNSNSTNNGKGTTDTDQKLVSPFTTWSGGKSQLDEGDPSRKKLNEYTERDQFNEELDQGKRKKIKNSIFKVNKFNELSKRNPFQTS